MTYECDRQSPNTCEHSSHTSCVLFFLVARSLPACLPASQTRGDGRIEEEGGSPKEGRGRSARACVRLRDWDWESQREEWEGFIGKWGWKGKLQQMVTRHQMECTPHNQSPFHLVCVCVCARPPSLGPDCCPRFPLPDSHRHTSLRDTWFHFYATELKMTLSWIITSWNFVCSLVFNSSPQSVQLCHFPT